MHAASKSTISLTIVAIFLLLLVSPVFAETIFTETWDSGVLDGSKWKSWGTPYPYVTTTGHESAYGLEPNGDSWHTSGVVSYETFNLSEHPSIRAWVNTNANGESSRLHYQEVKVGFSVTNANGYDTSYPSSGGPPGRIVEIRIEPQTSSYIISYGAPGYWFSEPYNPTDDNAQWNLYEIKIHENNTVSFYKNGVLKAHAPTPIDFSSYQNQSVAIGGRSVLTTNLVDDFVVTFNQSILIPEEFMADLVVSNLQTSSMLVEGTLVEINTTIENTGGQNASFTAELLIDSVSTQNQTLSLNSGASTITSFNWSSTEGVHTLLVRVDPKNEVAEGSEEDNDASTSISVLPYVVSPPPLTGQTLFEERWDTGSIDTASWTHWGSPAAVIKTPGYESTYAFDPNGDEWHESGVVTKQTFNLSRRPRIRFWANPNANGGSSRQLYQNMMVGFSRGTASEYAGDEGSRPSSLASISIRNEYLWYDVQYISPTETIRETYSPVFDGIWQWYDIVLNENNTISFYRNGKHKYTSVAVDFSQYENQALVLEGRSINTNNLIDTISITTTFTQPDVSTKPDLSVQNITYTPAALQVGTATTFNVTVQNTGEVDANAFTVEFFVDNQSKENKTLSVSNESINFLTFAWSGVFGPHEAKFVLDVLAEINESNETNNNGTKAVNVASPPAPPSPPSGGGSGGGGGGSFITTQDVDDEEELEEIEELLQPTAAPVTPIQSIFTEGTPVTHMLSQDEILSLALNDELHTVTVNEIGEDFVRLLVQSDPIEVLLQLGESTEVDVNSDGTADVRIALTNILNGDAELVFTQLLVATEEIAQGPTGFVILNQIKNPVLVGLLSAVALGGVVTMRRKGITLNLAQFKKVRTRTREAVEATRVVERTIEVDRTPRTVQTAPSVKQKQPHATPIPPRPVPVVIKPKPIVVETPKPVILETRKPVVIETPTTPHVPEATLKALNPREREIVEFLLQLNDPKGWCILTNIGRETEIPKSSLIRWIQSLERKGIIETRKVGKTRRVKLGKEFQK